MNPRTSLFRALPHLAFLTVALIRSLPAAELEFTPDLTTWSVVAPPPATDIRARESWFAAINLSACQWRVFPVNGKIHATRLIEKEHLRGPRPSFAPTLNDLGPATAFFPVSDGWLVAFNAGEFGAAQHWFSPDGKSNYKISDHHVVAFATTPNGIYAIEGLSHLTMSRGSLLLLERRRSDARWQAATVVKLPSAPNTMDILRDGTLVLALRKSLVSVSPSRRIRHLIPESEWPRFYPTSSALRLDEKTLYLGLGVVVASIDLNPPSFASSHHPRSFLKRRNKRMPMPCAPSPSNCAPPRLRSPERKTVLRTLPNANSTILFGSSGAYHPCTALRPSSGRLQPAFRFADQAKPANSRRAPSISVD